MDVATIKLALSFLRRVKLTGAEVPQYRQVEASLEQLLMEKKREQKQFDRTEDSR